DEKQSRCHRASRADERTGSHLHSFSRRVPVRAIDSVMDITLRSHNRAGVGINAQGGGGLVEALTCPTTAPGTECRSRKPWAVPLEQGIPVRRFTSRKGRRHRSGAVLVSHNEWPARL